MTPSYAASSILRSLYRIEYAQLPTQLLVTQLHVIDGRIRIHGPDWSLVVANTVTEIELFAALGESVQNLEPPPTETMLPVLEPATIFNNWSELHYDLAEYEHELDQGGQQIRYVSISLDKSTAEIIVTGAQGRFALAKSLSPGSDISGVPYSIVDAYRAYLSPDPR